MTLGPLWLQQGTHAGAAGLLGRRGYHILLSFSIDCHKGEDLGASSINRHCGKYCRSPCERSSILIVSCPSSQPLGQVLMHCLSIPGR